MCEESEFPTLDLDLGHRRASSAQCDMKKALRGPGAVQRRQRLKRVVSARHGGGRGLEKLFPTPPRSRSSFACVITATVVSLFTFQMCDRIHERPRILCIPQNEEGCAGRALKLGGLSPRTAARPWPRDKKPGRAARGVPQNHRHFRRGWWWSQQPRAA